MIGIREYAIYMQQVVDEIPALKEMIMVAEDNHAINRLKDKPGMILAAVIPNSQGTGDVGMSSHRQTGYLFVIEKRSNDATQQKEIDQYGRTQDAMLAVRSKIEEDAENGCSPFTRLEISSIGIEPEFNIFGGWNGWSMLFTF